MKNWKQKIERSKKSYFDVGVGNILGAREMTTQRNPIYGKILEHFIFTELRAYLDYNFLDYPLCYWRSTSQFEVDFVIPLSAKTAIGIEVKSARNPVKRDFKGLLALEEDIKLERKIVICGADVKRKLESGIEIYPLRSFLHELWKQQIF